MEAATHQEDIATRYRYMEEKDADGIFRQMTYTSLRPDAERNDYNVVLICLEGFSIKSAKLTLFFEFRSKGLILAVL